MYAQKRIRIEKDAVVRIQRVLLGKGQFLVAARQEVTPWEIIGSFEQAAGFRTLNIATLLSISAKDVRKYLQKKLGQRVYKGELIALKKGWFGAKKFATAPTDGILDNINDTTGEIRLTFLPKKVDLPAGVYGIVDGVDQSLGRCIIRTQATKIYGVLGTGKVRDGILHLLTKRDELILRSLISPKYEDHILVGGSLIFKDALSSAISASIKGVICGGINASDYKAMVGGKIVIPKKMENDVGITILAIEGFGSIAIGEDIYQILSEYAGKFAVLNGNQAVLLLPSFLRNSIINVRKTVLPKVELTPAGWTQTAEENPNQGEILQVKAGMLVRVIGHQYQGEQGKVIAQDSMETLLPSGIKSYLITIETRRRKIKIPFQNIEIIG